MKRLGILFALLCVFMGFAAAEDVYVLRVKTASGEAADLWARNMPVSAEALSLYAPRGFTISGKTVHYGRSAEIAFSVRDLGVVAKTPDGEVLHFAVAFSGKPASPMPSKIITVKIKASELKKDSVITESPGFLALNKAILQSKYKSGSAWIHSIVFDNKSTFTVKVALKN